MATEVVYEPPAEPEEPASAGNLWNREPVLIRMLAGQLIATAVTFGLPLDEAQEISLLGLVTLVLAVWTRRAVTPA